jgi:hypothetical protein
MNPSATLKKETTRRKPRTRRPPQQSQLQNSTKVSSSRNERNELYLAASLLFSPPTPGPPVTAGDSFPGSGSSPPFFSPRAVLCCVRVFLREGEGKKLLDLIYDIKTRKFVIRKWTYVKYFFSKLQTIFF